MYLRLYVLHSPCAASAVFICRCTLLESPIDSTIVLSDTCMHDGIGYSTSIDTVYCMLGM